MPQELYLTYVQYAGLKESEPWVAVVHHVHVGKHEADVANALSHVTQVLNMVNCTTLIWQVGVANLRVTLCSYATV